MNNKSKIESDVNEELKDFIRIVSHDMRAPIRHIKEFYQLFINQLSLDLDDGQRELQEYLEQAIDLATEQMDRLLIYSRLNTEKMTISEFEITELVTNTVDFLELEQKKTLNIHFEPQEKLVVRSSEKSLHLCCYEIIKNAVTFHHEDQSENVKIGLNINPDTFSLVIHDSGIGIEPKFRQDIFKAFRQLNHKGKFPGVGMGLTIAQRAAEMIKGDVKINANDEGGSTFVLTFPLILQDA